jgi:hypothetical protein
VLEIGRMVRSSYGSDPTVLGRLPFANRGFASGVSRL